MMGGFVPLLGLGQLTSYVHSTVDKVCNLVAQGCNQLGGGCQDTSESNYR